MSIYAKACTNEDVDNVGLRYFLMGHSSRTGNYIDLVPNGSKLNYVYDCNKSQKINLDLHIQIQLI